MEETAMALLTMYGIDTGLNYAKLNELSELVQKLSGMSVPPSRPFIGDGAYSIESGIVTGWFKNVFKTDPTTVFPVHPDFVGHSDPKILMGKKSGLDNIQIWTENLGIELDNDQALEVLNIVKLKSHDLKRVLTQDEFKSIALEYLAAH
jgi:isopropylmalate/homocitrate/citramalate synthase